MLRGTPVEEWRDAGVAAEQEMNGDPFLSLVDEVRGRFPQLRQANIVDVAASGLKQVSHPMRKRAVRCHAHGSVYFYRATLAASGQPSDRTLFKPNDAQDIELLMQVGLPAFVATNDRALLKHVDRSRTYQAPWIRTLVDLATADLPVCNPWGPAAKKAARDFRRSD